MSFLLGIIYLSFISLGLPDALLGSAWPKMYLEFQVPVSYAGAISMIIAFGTIVSSLQSDRLTKKFGTGVVTAANVGITAIALGGFSISHSFVALCLWAIPYGLGAGSVDASLNNYVALHYASKHMSWLHCMWGIGATIGPYIMGIALTGGASWNIGYRIICIMQIVLTAILIVSLPMWKKNKMTDKIVNSNNTDATSEEFLNVKEENCLGKNTNKDNTKDSSTSLGLLDVLGIPGAKEILICFFCYSAVEQTAMLWASSYLTLARNMSAEQAASFAGMFCIGITIGRGINGFIAMKLKDSQMIRMGQGFIMVGVIILFLPFGQIAALIGFVLIGLGCAPIYPCIIHSTPDHFGADKSQAVIGVQMACAYVGTCLMPPLFGMIANHISIYLLPVYLLVFLVLMIVMHEKLERKA